jgi:hypothetical protein
MYPIPCVHFLLLASLLFVDTTKSNNKGKIEGTKWTSLATTVKGSAIPADALKLEFSKDGKLIYKAGPKTLTGTYSLGMADTVTLKFTEELAGRKDHDETIKIVGDQLTMTDSDGTAVTFKKVK